MPGQIPGRQRGGEQHDRRGIAEHGVNRRRDAHQQEHRRTRRPDHHDHCQCTGRTRRRHCPARERLRPHGQRPERPDRMRQPARVAEHRVKRNRRHDLMLQSHAGPDALCGATVRVGGFCRSGTFVTASPPLLAFPSKRKKTRAWGYQARGCRFPSSEPAATPPPHGGSRTISSRAGLLAPGSPYSPRLPIPQRDSGEFGFRPR